MAATRTVYHDNDVHHHHYHHYYDGELVP